VGLAIAAKKWHISSISLTRREKLNMSTNRSFTEVDSAKEKLNFPTQL
jgi:hypothetical protein